MPSKIRGQHDWNGQGPPSEGGPCLVLSGSVWFRLDGVPLVKDQPVELRWPRLIRTGFDLGESVMERA